MSNNGILRCRHCGRYIDSTSHTVTTRERFLCPHCYKWNEVSVV